MTTLPPSDMNWPAFESWWSGIGERLYGADRAHAFSREGGRAMRSIGSRRSAGRSATSSLCSCASRVPTVHPLLGQERLTKNDPDYWLEWEQILKAATARLRELKPLIELLTTPNPLAESAMGGGPASLPVEEVELGKVLEGIAEAAGSYGGPDYASVIKQFDPVPLQQTQPFKHNKKHSAEL